MHYSDWLKFHGISGCHMWIVRAKCSQYLGTDIYTVLVCFLFNVVTVFQLYTLIQTIFLVHLCFARF